MAEENMAETIKKAVGRPRASLVLEPQEQNQEENNIREEKIPDAVVSERMNAYTNTNLEQEVKNIKQVIYAVLDDIEALKGGLVVNVNEKIDQMINYIRSKMITKLQKMLEDWSGLENPPEHDERGRLYVWTSTGGICMNYSIFKEKTQHFPKTIVELGKDLEVLQQNLKDIKDRNVKFQETGDIKGTQQRFSC